MNFPSIDIQGSILSAETLGKIRSEQELFQNGKDFSPELSNIKLKDEISFAWQEAKGQWQILKSKLARLKEGQTGTTETRTFWIIPLLSNLGYNLAYSSKSEEISGKSFQIPYRDTQLDDFPVYITGFYESLDKRPQNKQLRVSPHAMLQEYLNYSENLYGIITNGCYLRLLRDASRITRLSYLEFNLEKMMEEDLYSDFVLLYRLIHSSRMPRKKDAGDESIIEKYHQSGLEAGSKIRNNLGEAVKSSILLLANGFINHPDNISIREAISNGTLKIDDYYHKLLRIIYRLLFLFVIEERNLIYGDLKSSEVKRFNRIYYLYFSLMRLRKLAKKLPPPDAERNYDLWEGLLNSFALFENQRLGQKLGIMSLEGDLFGYNALCGHGFNLHEARLNNQILLRVLKALTYFENEQKVMISVNYGGLDVEEFGSVYEGLLELKLNISKIEGHDNYRCFFESGSERSRSGSHYTPEELVQPLIKHSLDYLINDRINEPEKFLLSSEVSGKTLSEKKVAALLKLKVCDVACGSGHILLSTARRIALEVARIKTEEEQPNPKAIRQALREVIRHCIYGVDKNELAVELCKIAMWLESYNPGEPLSFLDHHIKCGDSIVGLAKKEELNAGISEAAFKKMPGDDPEVIKLLLKKHRNESSGKPDIFESSEVSGSLRDLAAKFEELDTLPELTIDDVKNKAEKYNELLGPEWWRLKEAADMIVAQFFIPKTKDTASHIATYSDYINLFSHDKARVRNKIARAMGISAEKKIFHWFLEFPEVMQAGGFDCVLGNPPFLGGQRLSGMFGDNFLNWVKTAYAPAGSCDLVTYFFRRTYELLVPKGFQALLATNTIAQGGSREGGLNIIQIKGGTINFAIKSMPWPGIAAVDISIISIYKGLWEKVKILNNRIVKNINAYLDDSQINYDRKVLIQNKSKSFMGSTILGKGFLISEEVARNLLDEDLNYSRVIKQYLIGDDINSNAFEKATRWVICFHDWPLDSDWDSFQKEPKGSPYASDFPKCLNIVESLVKPEREQIDYSKGAKEKWWLYERYRSELYKTINDKKYIFAINRHSKYSLFSRQSINQIFSEATIVIASDEMWVFAILNSLFHEIWAWKFGSTLGSSELRYTPTEIFETFPFPQHLSEEILKSLEIMGEELIEIRFKIMSYLQVGLTKIYNLFHDNKDRIEVKEVSKSGTIDICKLILKDIDYLRKVHQRIDLSVLKAYGWEDIKLSHDFYEVDYLPENDRIRYTISPETRKEILKRLLDLNHKIHDEEIKSGLWEKPKKLALKKKHSKNDGDQENLYL